MAEELFVLKTNVDRLVKLSVVGDVVSPISRQVYRITAGGVPVILPGVGGITYNVRVGDPACGWEADHVEPGVSIENKENDPRWGLGANTALNVLSSVGNDAVVVSGEAKGSKGTVVGKHGGIEHVLVDFPPQAMEKMTIGDKVLVRSFGTGLKLLDFPDVAVMNIDPRVLDALDLVAKGDKLEVPVTHVVPAATMGSGLGADQTHSGDYDIQMFDEKTRREYGLGDIRLGDLVAIMDADHTFGRIYKQGAVSVGIVVHTDCVQAGHGPGVATLFTSSKGKIAPKISAQANVAAYLKLRMDIFP